MKERKKEIKTFDKIILYHKRKKERKKERKKNVLK